MPYIYRADVWCDNCGEAIKERIRTDNPKLIPEDEQDETSYDSDNWPKYYDAENEESDSPENCADGTCGGTTRQGVIGKFLHNQLTQDGYRYLKSMLDEQGEYLTDAAKEWAEYYQFTFHQNQYTSAHDWADAHVDYLVRLAAEGGADIGNGGAVSQLASMCKLFMRRLDGDELQDEYQDEMEDDDYFKQTGWYSPEMEDE